MRSNTVAFRGSKQVVEAYEANDIAPWAICCGKDIMFAYEGVSIEEGGSMLMEILKRMQAGSSSAGYMLRTYELDGKAKILSNTPYSRSFTFKLYDEDEEYSPFEAGRRHYRKEADGQIKALQEQIDLLKKQQEDLDEEEEKPEGIAGVIQGIFNDPTMKPIIMQAIAGVVSKIVPMRGNPAAVAGIPVEQVVSVLEPGQPEKVQQAVNVLCSKDPKLGDHLLKLAGIAVNNPGQFTMLIGMLTNF